MNFRLAGLIAALLAAAALGVAYFAQYGLHLVPCELCLWERWPYRIVIVLGLLAVLFGGGLGRVLVALAGVAMLGDVVIAGIHVGVEFHWWKSPLPECNGILTPGAPLPMTPSVSCERPVHLISWLPLSMTQMDFCAAILLTVLFFFMASRPRRGA
ncbi:disulfide bond formation protein B [Acidocella aminolytica]|jgi:disulfide bond formation protein DsbB|uniref:Disulfide bond formation protein B n=1 Tax=Acidocella aminolytica 101 = DSM 11237 TaxID=1120923 RepID=A0A0D6PAD9_9PROT|nr:disulfide bond formation protein B [Acidocella aminolytica]GAN78715.1 disulfide bond formation protein B [Acidocella aminolytica 101 = DSM 11237]GBQ38652.1 disulfide bond formation protein DsbB [Acidocella aminolytica 101 = DSM 11237]SHE78307.1 Disulfide bond formation protein DsbB [Acidocella aminolytica 101 = DSM 11237]